MKTTLLSAAGRFAADWKHTTGGVGGHMAGHHGLIGAAGGCAVGHHMAAKKAKEANPPS